MKLISSVLYQDVVQLSLVVLTSEVFFFFLLFFFYLLIKYQKVIYALTQKSARTFASGLDVRKVLRDSMIAS